MNPAIIGGKVEIINWSYIFVFSNEASIDGAYCLRVKSFIV